MQITGCSIGMMRFIVLDERQNYRLQWGDAYNETFYERWTHVVATYASGTGIMLYIDGNPVSHVSVSRASSSSLTLFRVGLLT